MFMNAFRQLFSLPLLSLSFSLSLSLSSISLSFYLATSNIPYCYVCCFVLFERRGEIACTKRERECVCVREGGRERERKREREREGGSERVLFSLLSLSLSLSLSTLLSAPSLPFPPFTRSLCLWATGVVWG